MRAPIVSATFALTLTGAVLAAEGAIPADVDVVPIDPVRIAYYEVAPRRVAASMRRAVAADCAKPRRGSSGDALGGVRRWLCDGVADTFLRGVDVLGDRSQEEVCLRRWWRSLRVLPRGRYRVYDRRYGVSVDLIRRRNEGSLSAP